MHEMGIMMGVMDSVRAAAENAGATKVTKVTLTIGDMTEIIQDALEFAFGVTTEGTICDGAELVVNHVHPRSLCLECGEEFDHDRFHRGCPKCGSDATQLINGRELDIESIEVDLPDDDEEDDSADTE